MKDCFQILPRKVPVAFALSLFIIMCLLQGGSIAAGSDSFHVNIGFSSKAFVNAHKEDVRVASRILSQNVAKKILGSAESRIYYSLSEMERDVKDHKLDVLALTPDDFLDMKNRTPLDPVVMTATEKGYEVDLLLLVRKDSRIRCVKDLKSRTIVLPSKTAQHGNLYNIWLENILAREGFPTIDKFFSSVLESRTASQALMPVFFETNDACVVTGHVFSLACELNPQIGKELRIIKRTNSLAGGIIALRDDLPAQRKQKITEALMSLQDDQEGRQLFVLFQLDRLVAYRPEYMKATEAFLAEYRSNRNRYRTSGSKNR